VLGGVTIAESTSALRVLETSHPPGIYIPPGDIADRAIQPASGTSVCEWKGQAVYWDVIGGDVRSRLAAWSYPSPSDAFGAITNYISWYPGRVDACYLDDELVTPQEGTFYGGWITADVVGPFKGARGTQGW
jgi:uncharacterized protein (DUF427 family)